MYALYRITNTWTTHSDLLYNAYFVCCRCIPNIPTRSGSLCNLVNNESCSITTFLYLNLSTYTQNAPWSTPSHTSQVYYLNASLKIIDQLIENTYLRKFMIYEIKLNECSLKLTFQIANTISANPSTHLDVSSSLSLPQIHVRKHFELFHNILGYTIYSEFAFKIQQIQLAVLQYR